MNNLKTSKEDILIRRTNSFSEKEIVLLNNLKVGIAGCGTLGGNIALGFARLGVKEIRLADPEQFEAANICKQYAATIETINTNKAQSVKIALEKINPYVSIKAFPIGISEINSDEFFNDLDVVIDAIEYFHTKEVGFLYNEVKKRKIWCFTGQAAGPYISVLEYSPDSKCSWFDLFQDKTGKVDPLLMSLKLFPTLKEKINNDEFKKFLQSPSLIPTNPSIPFVGPGIVFEEIINVIIKGRKPRALAPELLLLDLDEMNISIHSLEHA